ncbi:MAG: VCBS repeat-containing protein, partial [Myxococcales bacterium]|nr:VCBS repeat-containing protein [Myxococcales bacterium]
MTLSLLALVACTPDPIELPSAGSPFALTGAVDVAEEAGLQEWQVAGRLLRGRGCTVMDADLDGRPDLVLSNPADPTYVMLNRSTPGVFAFERGPVLDDAGLVWSASPADLDGDGDLDLFLAYGGLEGIGWNRLLLNQVVETGRVAFLDVTERSGLAGAPVPWTRPETGEELSLPRPQASMDGQWVDVDMDGDLDLWVDTAPWPTTSNAPDPEGFAGRGQLWRNDGDLRFTEIAEEVGLAAPRSHRFGQWMDLDHDGDPDLYANTMWAPYSAVFRNDGGSFVEITGELGLEGADLAMPPETFTAAAADLN